MATLGQQFFVIPLIAICMQNIREMAYFESALMVSLAYQVAITESPLMGVLLPILIFNIFP